MEKICNRCHKGKPIELFQSASKEGQLNLTCRTCLDKQYKTDLKRKLEIEKALDRKKRLYETKKRYYDKNKHKLNQKRKEKYPYDPIQSKEKYHTKKQQDWITIKDLFDKGYSKSDAVKNSNVEYMRVRSFWDKLSKGESI